MCARSDWKPPTELITETTPKTAKTVKRARTSPREVREDIAKGKKKAVKKTTPKRAK